MMTVSIFFSLSTHVPPNYLKFSFFLFRWSVCHTINFFLSFQRLTEQLTFFYYNWTTTTTSFQDLNNVKPQAHWQNVWLTGLDTTQTPSRTKHEKETSLFQRKTSSAEAVRLQSAIEKIIVKKSWWATYLQSSISIQQQRHQASQTQPAFNYYAQLRFLTTFIRPVSRL